MNPVFALHQGMALSQPFEINTSAIAPVKNSFINMLQNVNHQFNTADNMLQSLAQGSPIPPSKIMMQLTEAKLALQALIEVRNRCLSAYQTLSREQW